jgi:hypothetical protein
VLAVHSSSRRAYTLNDTHIFITFLTRVTVHTFGAYSSDRIFNHWSIYLLLADGSGSVRANMRAKYEGYNNGLLEWDTPRALQKSVIGISTAQLTPKSEMWQITSTRMVVRNMTSKKARDAVTGCETPSQRVAAAKKKLTLQKKVML